MSICLSHKSADLFFEVLSHRGFNINKNLEVASGSLIEGFSSSFDEARNLLGDDLRVLTPLELLVGNPHKLHGSQQVATHLWTSTLPDGAIKKYCDGLYVVSPEFCLLQQARELHFVNLCQMLGRYMATASPQPSADGSGKLAKRGQITDIRRLEEFLRAAKRPYGAKQLRAAMSVTLPAAASPQETNLQLIFTLPRRYYGFGFKHLVLNHHMDLGAEARGLCGKEEIFVDLYFGKPHLRKGECEDDVRAFGLEYQGVEWHQDPSSDVGRFLAAHAEGVDLWYVANDQIKSPQALDYLAREAARRMRRVINPKTWPSEKDLAKLLDVL